MFLSVKERTAGSGYMETKGRDLCKIGYIYVCVQGHILYRSVETEMVFVCK
jgi:hypothetical protein